MGGNQVKLKKQHAAVEKPISNEQTAGKSRKNAQVENRLTFRLSLVSSYCIIKDKNKRL